MRSQLFALGLPLMVAAFGADTPPIQGIDHIPVVVSNLAEAQAHYRAMGFALKPGRYHANGIQNAHVKFPDGTEIELITAPKAVDALTTEYRTKLKHSNGPVYFGLYAPDQAALAARLRQLTLSPQIDDGLMSFPAGNPLHPEFFGLREKAPTDRPEHFAHPNTATRLSALWVRDIPEFHRLLRELNIPLQAERACGPISRSVTVATLPEGRIILVPNAITDVIGARIEVRKASAAEHLLKDHHIPQFRDERCDPKSVWVPPEYAGGVWLQFSEADSDQ